MDSTERKKFAELSAKLCSNYAKYIEALSNDCGCEKGGKLVFKALAATSAAQDKLELFIDSLLEKRLRIALHALTEEIDGLSEAKEVGKEIDDIIRRREEMKLPPETYRGE